MKEQNLEEGFGSEPVKIEGVLDPKTGDVRITVGGEEFNGLLFGSRASKEDEITIAASGDKHKILQTLTIAIRRGLDPFRTAITNTLALKVGEPLIRLGFLDRDKFIESLGLRGGCPCPECNPSGEPAKNTGPDPLMMIEEASKKAKEGGGKAEETLKEAEKMGASPSREVH